MKVSAEAHVGVLQKTGIESFDAVHALTEITKFY